MKEGKPLFHDLGIFWLRFMMGAGIAYHGYGKVFGGKMAMFAQGVAQMGFPLPEFFAWAAALSEFVGGILIAAGLLTRPAALFVFVTMSVAVFIKHSADPFQVKELALAFWTMSGMLILTGGGAFSLERLIKK